MVGKSAIQVFIKKKRLVMKRRLGRYVKGVLLFVKSVTLHINVGKGLDLMVDPPRIKRWSLTRRGLRLFTSLQHFINL